MPLTRIESSPRRRTLETARYVAQGRNLSVELVDALDEIDFGTWSGCSFADLAKDPEWDRWNREREAVRPPSGETIGEVRQRALAHVMRLGAVEGPVLCVTHGDIIRCLIVTLQGRSLADMLQVEAPPASIIEIDVAGEDARLVQAEAA